LNPTILPEEPGDVQRALNIVKEGSYIVARIFSMCSASYSKFTGSREQ